VSMLEESGKSIYVFTDKSRQGKKKTWEKKALKEREKSTDSGGGRKTVGRLPRVKIREERGQHPLMVRRVSLGEGGMLDH